MIGSLFEKVLWGSRYIVVIAVVVSLLTSLAMFYIATIDALILFSHLLEYANPLLSIAERGAQRIITITHVVEVIDGYLLATVLLIFALGLYELFINKIEIAENKKIAGNVLVINSLDDLKNRLAKVILMILIVKFFEHAIKISYEDPLSILYLSIGIAFIGLALYLTHASEGKSH